MTSLGSPFPAARCTISASTWGTLQTIQRGRGHMGAGGPGRLKLWSRGQLHLKLAADPRQSPRRMWSKAVLPEALPKASASTRGLGSKVGPGASGEAPSPSPESPERLDGAGWGPVGAAPARIRGQCRRSSRLRIPEGGWKTALWNAYPSLSAGNRWTPIGNGVSGRELSTLQCDAPLSFCTEDSNCIKSLWLQWIIEDSE